MTRVPAERRREELVQAALRVIDRDGVHGATTRAIVTEAKMSLASFHYVFRSRDELIRSLVAHVIEGERAATLSALDAPSDIRTLVRATLTAYFDHVRSAPGHEQAVFELFHYSLRTEELSDLPKAQYLAYRELASSVLEAGASIAGIRWTLPLDDLARIVISLTDGLTLNWLADRDDAATVRLIDAAADMLTAFAAPPE